MESDTTKPSNERDVSKFIETAVLGVLDVLISVFRTGYAFARRPDAVWAEARATGTFRRYYTRPATYASITIAASIALIAKGVSNEGAPSEGMPPVIGYFLHALANVESIKVLLFIFPFLLAVALYAGLVSGVARLFRVSIGFQDSLSLAFYFIGSMGLFYTIGGPLSLGMFRLWLSKSSLYNIIEPPLAIFWFAIVFRYLYCYLHLLRSILQLSRWRTVRIWLTAMSASFFCYAAIFLYILWAFEPVYPEKHQAIDHAQNRARFRSSENSHFGFERQAGTHNSVQRIGSKAVKTRVD